MVPRKFSHCKEKNTIRSLYYVKVNSKCIFKNLEIKFKMKEENIREYQERKGFL